MVASTHLPLRFGFIKSNLEQVRFFNKIVGQARKFSFEFKEELYSFSFLSKKSETYTAKLYFRLRCNDNLFYLCLNELPDLSFFDEALKDLKLMELPADILALILESFSEDLLSQAEHATEEKFSLKDVVFSPPKEAFENTVHFKVLNTHTQKEYLGHIWFNNNLRPLFLKSLNPESLDVYPTWMEAKLNGDIIIGYTNLLQSDYLGIDCNDIIVLDNSQKFKENVLSLEFGSSFGFECQYQKNKATVLKMSETPPHIPTVPTSKKPTAPVPVPSSSEAQSSPAAPQLAQTSRLDDITVQLSFSVGQKQMTFEELKSVSPGFTFELDVPVSKPVDILLNGLLVGSGELLQIGEKVGVRVIDFKHNG